MSHAHQVVSQQAYLAKFKEYLRWRENLPKNAPSDFIQFIKQDSPLNNRLRDMWLLRLGQEKKWDLFLQYYQPSSSVALQCYAETALYYKGEREGP